MSIEKFLLVPHTVAKKNHCEANYRISNMYSFSNFFNLLTLYCSLKKYQYSTPKLLCFALKFEKFNRNFASLISNLLMTLVFLFSPCLSLSHELILNEQ